MDTEPCWYHCVITTYGAWLYGDSRGFCTRHHREHVEGDYKNPPPPGEYEDVYRRSQRLLKGAPVVIPPDLRRLIGLAIKEKLEALRALLVCLSVSGQHVHVLVKLPKGHAREWIGIAKKHVWFELRDRGWKGKLWGKRGKELPVKGRLHQLNVYRYIMRHASQGAWVWTMIKQK